MAYAFGAALGTTAASGVSTTSFTTTAAVASGGLIVAGAGWYNAVSNSGVGLSGGGLTWQNDVTATPNADTKYHVALYSAVAPVGLASGTTLTLTLTGAAFAITFDAAYWTGSAAASWFDLGASGNSATGTISASITPTAANELIVARAWVDLSNTTATPDTANGWLEVDDFLNVPDGNTASMIYQIVGAATAYTPQTVFAAGGPAVMAAAAYKGADAGGGGAALVMAPTFNPIPFMGGVL